MTAGGKQATAQKLAGFHREMFKHCYVCDDDDDDEE